MKTPEKAMVSFFMVGCQRCGTSWTDAALRTHPQVYLPDKKQSYFFDRHYENGIDWFMERFTGVEPQHRAVGEIATGYCLVEVVPLMAAHFPDIKLLLVMRNPIDRAYSNFQTRQIEFGWDNFEQAIQDDVDFLERGQYCDQIDELLKYYKRDQILFLLYDDLNSDDRKYLKTILDFIGVDSTIKSKMIGQRKNAAMFPALRNTLHKLGLDPVVRVIRKSFLGDWLRRTGKKKGKSYSPMNPKTREKLIEHFRPYNNRLATQIQRDLSHWNN